MLELTLFVCWIISIWFSSSAEKSELIWESCSRKAALEYLAITLDEGTEDRQRHRCRCCTSRARLTLKAAWILEVQASEAMALFDRQGGLRFGGSPFFGGS